VRPCHAVCLKVLANFRSLLYSSSHGNVRAEHVPARRSARRQPEATARALSSCPNLGGPCMLTFTRETNEAGDRVTQRVTVDWPFVLVIAVWVAYAIWF
jgi:hypothetical protein